MIEETEKFSERRSLKSEDRDGADYRDFGCQVVPLVETGDRECPFARLW